jgi:hypothetical protein
MTTESSTTITRIGSCRVAFGAGEFVNATLIIHRIRLKSGTMETITPKAIQPPER